MEFRGFPTVAAFKHACTDLHIPVERKTVYKDDMPYVLLVVGCSGTSASEIGTWHIFTDNESKEVLSGIVPNAEWMQRTGGIDMNFIGVLKEHGFSIRETVSE